MEAAQDTEKLFENFGETSNRFPEDDTPVIKTDLSSDMNQRPAFTEGGMEWLPVNEDSDLASDDVVDSYEKKRVRLPSHTINEVADVEQENRKEIPSFPKSVYQPIDSFRNHDESSYEKPTFGIFPQDDEDENFQWNPRFTSSIDVSQLPFANRG
ncbi:hypothetical protein X975_10780, partial [Stegodyphus mimosarum]